jgi:flagellar biosynthesis protein FlhF
MLLKTYRASDLAAALAKARAELGPDALVLATTEVRGRGGLSGVEVTLASPRGAGDGQARADERIRRLAHEVREARRKLDEKEAIPEVREQEREAANEPSATTTVTEDPLLGAATRALVASGVSDDLAARFARIASRGLDGGGDAGALARAVERGVGSIIPFEPIPSEARCFFVVGPPGSGKTTTVAKLAARMSVERSGPVFFAEADGERIGSFEQAEIFCRHLGTVAARVNGPEDLARVLTDAGDSGAVLIDTPGIGTSDDDRLRFVDGLRQMVPGASVALLMPAGLHHDDAARIIETFEPLDPTCAAFTRVDDGTRVGELVTALASSTLPLAFYTDGHRVPEDLGDASPRKIAALLLRAAYGAGNRQEIHA